MRAWEVLSIKDFEEGLSDAAKSGLSKEGWGTISGMSLQKEQSWI